MEATQQYFIEMSDNSNAAFLQRPHATGFCGQWPAGQSFAPWAGPQNSDTGIGPMDCSQAMATEPQFERTRHAPPSFGQYLQHPASTESQRRTAAPDVPTYNGYVVNWVLSSSSSSQVNVAQAEGGPANCPSPCATPSSVHRARSPPPCPPRGDSLDPHVCRALDELAGQQQSSPDEPLFGRKDKLSVNWTTYWDERESCFKLLYVGAPRLQMQCNSNAKGEISHKRKHPSGDPGAENTDVNDDIKLSKAVKLVNIRHVTFAPEFV